MKNILIIVNIVIGGDKLVLAIIQEIKDTQTDILNDLDSGRVIVEGTTDIVTIELAKDKATIPIIIVVIELAKDKVTNQTIIVMVKEKAIDQSAIVIMELVKDKVTDQTIIVIMESVKEIATDRIIIAMIEWEDMIHTIVEVSMTAIIVNGLDPISVEDMIKIVD